MKKTKIIATIGPSSKDEATIRNAISEHLNTSWKNAYASLSNSN